LEGIIFTTILVRFGFKNDTTMPQTLLPFFPEEATLINQYLGVQQREDTVYYFNGQMPIFKHLKDDHDSFHLFTSQLIDNGNCKQMDIVRCFGVSPISVKRWVKKYRERKHLQDFVSKKRQKKTEGSPQTSSQRSRFTMPKERPLMK